MLPANHLWLSGFLPFKVFKILCFCSIGTYITSVDLSEFFDPKSLLISSPFWLLCFDVLKDYLILRIMVAEKAQANLDLSAAKDVSFLLHKATVGITH